MKKENFKKALYYGIIFTVVMFIINFIITPLIDGEEIIFEKWTLSIFIFLIGGFLVGLLDQYIKVRREKSK